MTDGKTGSPTGRARRVPARRPSLARTGACRSIRQRVIPVLAMLMLTLGSAITDAAPRQAPGSRVVIELPEHFTPSNLFTGFSSDTTGATVVILELPGQAYDEMRAGFTPEALARQGVRNATSAKLPRPDDHLFMVAEQTSPSGDVAKFFVLFRDGGVTVLVSANIPKGSLDNGDIPRAAIEHALASARTSDAPAAAPALYTLGYLGPFQEAGVLLGHSRLYTEDGRLQAPEGGELRAAFIVAPSIDRRPIADLGAFSRVQFQSLAADPGQPILRTLTVSGLDAVEIVTSAEDNAMPSPADGFYQLVVRLSGGGYFRLVGTAPMARWPALLPEFRRMGESFVPTL